MSTGVAISRQSIKGRGLRKFDPVHVGYAICISGSSDPRSGLCDIYLDPLEEVQLE
jgi:hypothetical protein